ncbi:MAG: S-layer homology domain-containing protein [bacterium]|nr:S-layer homology domain-containing protein [bacterium]
MSKKIRKLLSGLLALAMAASSGIAAFADEPSAADTSAETVAADTADATETPEDTADETEAPEDTATEAPEEPEATATPVPDKYAADAYYQKALTLCKSLGIITGYDDGSIKPESTVTRAEMAAIILRMTATESTSAYRSIFDDVTTSHWAADTIQTAADAKVINGMGDGLFMPDGEVLYEQAIKMVVCGMNYQNEANAKGGYPEGYVTVAAVNLKLLEGVKGYRGQALERGEIIKMIYNALLGPMHKVTSYGPNGELIFDPDQDETLAKAKFDVVEEKGLLTGTPRTAITATKPADGQITIDGDTYLCSIADVDNYVANEITYYYIDNNKQDPEVVAITTNSAKTSELTLKADEIDTVKNIVGEDGRITTYNDKTYKTENAYIIYNGDLIDEAIYTAAVNADTTKRFNKINKDGTDTGKKLSYDEFVTPEAGSVRMVDNDGDGKYDVVFITSAETMLITSATDKKVIGKIKNNAVTLDVDTAENANLVITVTKDGSEAKPKNLKKNEVVSVVRNLDQDIMTFDQVSDTLTGKIQSFTTATETENAYITINGAEYEVDINAVADCSTGLDATIYLDKYGRVGYVESESLISSTEKYGWILSAYLSDSGDNYVARIFSQDGAIETYNFASKVNYWGPNDTEASSGLDASALKEKFRAINYNQTKIGDNLVDIRLIKFGTNSKGEISKIYFAKVISSDLQKGSSYSTTTYDKKSLVVEGDNLTGISSTGNLVDRYYMSDDMLEFTVPNINDEMNNTDTYAVSNIKASSYLDKENGSSKSFIVGEFSDDKQTYPTVVIRFEGSADKAKPITDYDTAANNPCFMLEKMYSGVDVDDNEIYTLVGYQNGGQVKYTTKKNTTLAKVNGGFDGSRNYNAAAIWDGVNGMTDAGKSEYPGAKVITDILGEGDIIGVSGNGEVLMLMVDASELATQVKNGEFEDKSYKGVSSGRDSLYIGRVEDSDLGENAVMTVSGNKLLFDAGRSMDTLVIDEVGHVDFSSDNVSTISDVMDYDDEYGTGDYAFVRYAAKGELQEIFLFRFED